MATLLMLLSFQVRVYAEDVAKPYLCTTQPIIKMTEASVVNLLFITQMAQATAEGKLSGDVKEARRDNCGLPGEEWRVCTKCTDEIDMKAYKKILPLLATPEHRDWHYTWHNIRLEINADGMYQQPPSDKQIREWKKTSWLPEDSNTFPSEHGLGTKLSGEDFFFMHRQMIKMVQVEMAAQGGACIAPWKSLPKSAKDKKWPLPREDQAALDDLNKILDKLTTTENLKSSTLSQFGNKVEAEVHRKLHEIYAATKSRCNDANTDNSVTCDDLSHDRSAHMNPMFWKIHGLMDEMIGKWLKANNYTSIKVDCAGTERCYQWKGTWLGNYSAMSGE